MKNITSKEIDILNDLIQFIYTKTLLPRSISLNLNSKLFEDIGLTGIDAVEFIIAFGNRFNVDVSSFNSLKYFDADGIIFKWSQKNDLTINDLLLGIINSKLDETTIQKNHFK